MITALSPQRWTNMLSIILNTAYGANRFPVNVEQLALDYSRQRYTDDPVSLVHGESLPGFDGALLKAPKDRKGWGIIYNSKIKSPGRINFTLAHEFGHYLLHRHNYPDGIECNQQDMIRWDSEYGQVEHQANEFAASLLMPLDDFRNCIDSRAKPTFEDISDCATRYGVSLIAATLRWLEYTERRAILVVSREGFILWARSSQPAFKSGAFFRTTDRPPIEVPANALVTNLSALSNRGSFFHPAGVWLEESCEEVSLVSDQYDLAISLLHFENTIKNIECDEPPEYDVFDKMTRVARRTF
jgi:hypothetical protein